MIHPPIAILRAVATAGCIGRYLKMTLRGMVAAARKPFYYRRLREHAPCPYTLARAMKTEVHVEDRAKLPLSGIPRRPGSHPFLLDIAATNGETLLTEHLAASTGVRGVLRSTLPKPAKPSRGTSGVIAIATLEPPLRMNAPPA